jgi:hypothetical protein
MRAILGALAALLLSVPASATFHLWQMSELYSNASGTVQFLELSALSGGQQFVAGHVLTAGGNSFTFPSNLPGDSQGRRMLVGTQAFAALNIVAPDYIVPNNFFPVGGGTVNFAEFADVWNYGPLPGGTLSLGRSGATATNSPMNFAGQTGTVPGSTTPPPPDLNFQALWWRSPAGSENGWGLNVTHQGDALFVTWFTYGADSNDLWMVMDNMRKVGNNSYFGNIYQTRSAPFSAYDGAQFTATQVGTATLSFSDASNGSFTYTVNGSTETKPITKFVYGSPVPTCVAGTTSAGAVSYQDLWWRSPAGSENGWGVNITHQGDALFATWFTYGADGSRLWLVMDNAMRTTPTSTTYAGNVYRTRSSPFNAYDGSRFSATQVGTASITFTDANNATFSYTVNGISQTKPLTRFVFSSPVTTCYVPVNSSTMPMPGYPGDPYPQ